MFADTLSKILRYVFVLLAGFVAVRGFLWLRKDMKQYKKIIRRLPDAGLIGEIYCPATGKKVPLPREGSMGRFTSCDVKLKGNGVRGIHAHFLFVSGKGLKIMTRSGKRVEADGRKVRGSAMLLSGSELILGSELFVVRFFAGLNVPRHGRIDARPAGEREDMPGPDQWDGYEPDGAGYYDPLTAADRDNDAPEGWGEDNAPAYYEPRPAASAPRYPYPPAQYMSAGQEESNAGMPENNDDWGPDQ